MVRTDNNPLTYVFSPTSLDAAGQHWVAKLADYNFSPEYQKGKYNTVADFLSRVEDRLPEAEVETYLAKIPCQGTKAALDNAITPVERWAEFKEPSRAQYAEVLGTRPAKLAKMHVTDWKKVQKEDPVLFAVVKNLRVPWDKFKAALSPLLDKKAVHAYEKKWEKLVMKDGLLYLKTDISPAKEPIWCFVVPKEYCMTAVNGCHHEAGHQGQKHSTSLLVEGYV